MPGCAGLGWASPTEYSDPARLFLLCLFARSLLFSLSVFLIINVGLAGSPGWWSPQWMEERPDFRLRKCSGSESQAGETVVDSASWSVPEDLLPPEQPCLGPAPLAGPGLLTACSYQTGLEDLSWHTCEPPLSPRRLFSLPCILPHSPCSLGILICVWLQAVTPEQCPGADGRSQCSALLAKCLSTSLLSIFVGAVSVLL